MRKLKNLIFLLLITIFVINCKSNMTFDSNGEYICSFDGNQNDITNFLDSVNENKKVYVEKTENMFLFFNDSTSVKTYFFDSKNSIIHTPRSEVISARLKSDRRYKAILMDSSINSYKIKVFSDNKIYTNMEGSIIIDMTKSGNGTEQLTD
ncbi:hypothetical protein [Winogradskyella sp.]|uniref:hypothetical protein n=1 Tax=Winogradskyella sp. TaxID=1883156 RepID=UPI003BAA1F3D